MSVPSTRKEGAPGWDLLKEAPDPGNPGSPPATVDPTGECTLEILEDFPAYSELIWKRVTNQVGVSGRVLEMGCGIGSISRMILRSPGVESLTGVDMNPEYVARVAAEIPDARLRLACSTAEDYCPGRELFDRVVSINVLEHVKDDQAALANFERMLRPGGECAILVPAHPFLYSSLDRSLSHHRRYSRAGLAGRARAAGLQPVRITHFNPLGALGWWLNGKLLRRRCLSRGQVAAYTRFLLQVSAAIDRLNPFPVGISLIARLVKPG